MRIVKSDYREDVVFVGFDGEVSDEEIIKMLRHDFGWEDGSDFDGIRREEMDSTHTNTEYDFEDYVDLSNDYDNVEFVTLCPVR